MHERKPGEELVVVKSKPTWSLVSRSVNRSPMLDSGVSYSSENYGMQCRNSDRSGIKKVIARNVKDVNENAASSSEVWHQNENTRSGIEKSMAKAHQRSSIEKSTAKKIKFDSQQQSRPITTSRSLTLHTLRKSLRMYVRQKNSVVLNKTRCWTSRSFQRL